MKLSDLFEKIAAKRLSAVETEASLSHQHELNGVKDLMALFGKSSDKKNFPALFLYLHDDEEAEESISVSREKGTVTWYDARASHPKRTEYRLYYSVSSFIENASEGDLLIVGFNGNQVWFIVAAQGSDIEAQLLWLFDLREEFSKKENTKFQIKDLHRDKHSLNIIEQKILEQLGFKTELDIDLNTEDLLSRFKGKFPTTSEFSSYTRELSGIKNSLEDPDGALLRWWEEEEKLFRALERKIVEKQLDKGFKNVNHFTEFAKSVLNRRNSRAGHAFENHITQILTDHHIYFDRGKRTEYKSKPDFIFPSIDIYHKASADSSLIPFLTMLAAKTSCKDRWRQITKEAKLIKTKHLITLEPSISVDQTDEMNRHSVQLIIPEDIFSSYLPEQQKWLMTLGEFIIFIAEKQKNIKFDV